MRYVQLILLLFFAVLTSSVAQAVVELAPEGQSPKVIDEVYWQDQTFFVAIEDVLAAVDRSGEWDSVKHVYRFDSPRGSVVIAPGSQFVKVDGSYRPLNRKPRFIDNRLRVPEEFVTRHLPDLIRTPIYYRNLTSREEVEEEEPGTLDRLFAMLLRREASSSNSARLRALALDPGHGGFDTGTIGLDGVQEKEVALATARQLAKITKMRLGVPVYLSRDGDYAVTPAQRLEPALKEEVDALLILHAQASWDVSVDGAALIVRPQEEFEGERIDAERGDSMRLARHIQQSLEAAGIETSGIYQAALPALGRGNLPTVLVELGYLTNTKDHARLVTDAGRETIAQALYDGLQNFIRKTEEKAP
ncbi:N-acetylmuramoyl-L-alanine amidase family protein [Geoalkalibacter subterraneus]|uniref:N-acetylmuramoyl-L-alanine amidase n=1 Tax=Geoalkalibacter subterraneus TaxID=483547 RepID=A0A0B5FMX4_9BACT|nr:N-acetylmuramoyl-L-alanine amidase [Geoalkalibacter subterraneus]AJF05984.1 hypothetical protein GSUB_04615 [Geoalkalibacter subterraneus]